MILTKHNRIFSLPLLYLLITQATCAAQPLSVADTRNQSRKDHVEQERPKSELSPSALEQIESILQEKAACTPAHQKISSQLLYEIKIQRGEDVT